MSDSEEEFTYGSLMRGSQTIANPTDYLEVNMDNLDASNSAFVNEGNGEPSTAAAATPPAVPLAFGVRAKTPAARKKGKKRKAEVLDNGDGPAAGSQHQPETIGSNAQRPKLDAHIHVDPKKLVGFKQIKHAKYCYEGFRYNLHSTLKSGVLSYECEIQRDGCRGRLWVYPDGTCEVRNEHSIHSADNDKSKLVKVSTSLFFKPKFSWDFLIFFFWHNLR